MTDHARILYRRLDPRVKKDETKKKKHEARLNLSRCGGAAPANWSATGLPYLLTLLEKIVRMMVQEKDSH